MKRGIVAIMKNNISASGSANQKKLSKIAIISVLRKNIQKVTDILSKKSSHISNGNRTEWSPIRSVIIRVISKIGRPRSGSPICLITSMITDRIGRHEVLLPINHNFNKICVLSY